MKFQESMLSKKTPILTSYMLYDSTVYNCLNGRTIEREDINGCLRLRDKGKSTVDAALTGHDESVW